MVLSISLPVFSSSFLLIIFFSAFFLFFFFLFRLFFSSFRFHFVYFSLSYLLIFLASCSSLFLPSSRRLARWGSSSSGQIHLQTGVVWKGKVGWWWGGEMNSDYRGQTNDANPMAASWVRLVVYYSRAFHEKEFYCICDHSLTTSSFDKSWHFLQFRSFVPCSFQGGLRTTVNTPETLVTEADAEEAWQGKKEMAFEKMFSIANRWQISRKLQFLYCKIKHIAIIASFQSVAGR